MPINTAETREIAELILGLRDDKSRKSTLQLALESANFHLGISGFENANRGAFEWRHHFAEHILKDKNVDRCSDEAEIFSALLLYLNILEQIGTLFCEETGDSNNIVKAINSFSPRSLTTVEIGTIKNLRNSLAHNFGLVNYDLKSNKPTAKYTICFDNTQDVIVELPEQDWNGEWENKLEKTSCHVYAFPLIRLVGQIILEVIKQYKEDSLSFAISELEEIKTRFTIMIKSN